MIVKLPQPDIDSHVSLEQSLARRRSIRNFIIAPLSLSEVSQLLWAAQGITSSEGYRTAPSAGALYPLEIYTVAGTVENLDAGIYHYNPEKHELALTVDKDRRQELTHAALEQSAIRNGAISLVITAIYERTTLKYGQRGIQYVHMDAGHAAQNICLQASALNLGTVPIGAFNDREVRAVLQLRHNEEVLYILPVGKY